MNEIKEIKTCSECGHFLYEDIIGIGQCRLNCFKLVKNSDKCIDFEWK